MDGCNLEPGRGVLNHERRVHELLRNAAARLEAMGLENRPKWTGALYLDENALQIPSA